MELDAACASVRPSTERAGLACVGARAPPCGEQCTGLNHPSAYAKKILFYCYCCHAGELACSFCCLLGCVFGRSIASFPPSRALNTPNQPAHAVLQKYK